MTVTEAMIALVSPFTVAVDGDFTTTDFAQYSTWAKEELDRDDPGLPTSKYDECHANLICDIFASSKGAKDMKSEKIGDYGYTRDVAGKTSYRIRYEEILKNWAIEQPTTEQEREDLTYFPDQFQLDQQTVAKFEESD